MANLIQLQYLHSKKWTFFNAVGAYNSYGSSNKTNGNLDNKIEHIKKHLEELRDNCIKRETQFYTDYGCASREQWQERHLRTINNKKTLAQKFLDIMHTHTVYDLLMDENNFTEQFIQEVLNMPDITEEIRRSFENIAQDIPNTIGEVLERTNLLSSGEVNSMQKQILTSLGGGKFNGKIQNVQSKSLAKVKKALKEKNNKKTSAPIDERIERVCTYVKTELEKFASGNEDDLQKIPDIISMLRVQLKNDPQIGKDRQKTKGETQEIESTIVESSIFKDTIKAGIKITIQTEDNQYKNIYTSVDKIGQVAVDRFGKSVQSKIDNIYISPKGSEYRVQQKNSEARLFDELDELGNIPEAFKYDPSIKIQDKIKLSNFLEEIKALNVHTDEEIKYLTYLIVNYNVLNQYSLDEKIGKKNTATTVSASFIASLIDKLLSADIQLYISDILFGNDGKLKPRSYDFIIYRSQILIPVSYIYQSLIDFLDNQKETLLKMHATSKAQVGATLVNNMEKKKIEARIGDGKPYDYHNDNLVAAGQEGFVQALPKVEISGIRLIIPKKTITNLISK